MKELEKYEDEALRVFRHELTRARILFPYFADDLFQSISLLSEEFGETSAAVNDYKFGSAPLDQVIVEAGQTMAVAFRTSCFALRVFCKKEDSELEAYEDQVLRLFIQEREWAGSLLFPTSGGLFQAISLLGVAVGNASEAVNDHAFHSMSVARVVGKSVGVMLAAFRVICFALHKKYSANGGNPEVIHGHA